MLSGMHTARGRNLYMLRSLTASLLLLVFCAISRAESGSASLDSQRLWISPKTATGQSGTKLHVSYVPENALPSDIGFECEVTAVEPVDEVHLVMTVLDPQGVAIHTGESRLGLGKGSARAAFTWPCTGLSDGQYAATFDLHLRSGGELASQRLSLSLLTGTNVRSKIESVRSQLAPLRDTLDKLAASNTQPAYPTLHTAIIEDYLPFAEGALKAGNWRRADEFASYLNSLANTARLELSLITPATAADWKGERDASAKLEIQNGGFVCGGIPRFLFGSAYQPGLSDALPLLERYGLDLAVYRTTPSDTLADASKVTGFAGPMGTFLNDAAKRGLRAVLDLAPEDLPGWAMSPALDAPAESSFHYDLMAEAPRTVLSRHIAAVLDAAKDHPNVLSVSLARDPALKLRDSTLRDGLIALAKSHYQEYATMNRKWRTRYMGFDEIEVDWGSRHPAYLYDLASYHQELGAQLFSWLAQLSRGSAPGLPVQVQFADSAFAKGQAARGIDLGSILANLDISGCSPAQDFNDSGLAWGLPRQTACYTLMRSLQPGAPVMNTDDRFHMPASVTGDAAYGRVRAMVWEAVMAGLSGSAIRLGKPGSDDDGVLSRPELIDAYATACLDINRLAPIVAALQNAPAPVRVLWSPSSAMYAQGEPYLDSALRAFAGASNFGARTLFISERECERNGLEGVKVLVVPEALALTDGAFRAIDRYIEAGGVTIRQGNPFPYDQQGISRTDTVSVSNRTILLRSDDTVRSYLDALDGAYALGGMESPPRVVNEYGYPIDGVMSRFVTYEGVSYLYLINLRDEPVRGRLFGPYTGGTDLVSGNLVAFPDAIDPLTPMLIQLDPATAPAKLASNAEEKTAPSIELKPVGAQTTPKRKVEPRTSMRFGN